MIRMVLASASPRRQALLAALGVNFDIRASGVEETLEGDSPAAIVEENARRKCEDVARRLDVPAVVIAADTLVFLDDHILPKPADQDEARAMLRRLSGNTHQVRTGLAVENTPTGDRALGSETTHVTFRALDEELIRQFVKTVNPLDRAGAYTVDGPGSLLVERYEGCYQNVLGFPMVRLDRMLAEINIHLLDYADGNQASFL